MKPETQTAPRSKERRGRLGNLVARLTGLEPATPGVTGRYSNQLSYNRATRKGLTRIAMARLTGLEPATPGVTGRYSNQLSYNRASRRPAAPNVRRVLGTVAGGVKRRSAQNRPRREIVQMTPGQVVGRPGNGRQGIETCSVSPGIRRNRLRVKSLARQDDSLDGIGVDAGVTDRRWASGSGRPPVLRHPHGTSPLVRRIAGAWGVHAGKWWVVRGSNPRHPRCKRDALPTELTTRAGRFSPLARGPQEPRRTRRVVPAPPGTPPPARPAAAPDRRGSPPWRWCAARARSCRG